MSIECHKCEHNGKMSEQCLHCTMDEKYSYKYKKYIFDGYDIPDDRQQKREQDEVNLQLTEEQEDKFRKTIYEIFDLSPLQLLMLQAIVTGKDLSSFARQINKMTEKLKDGMTRQHAYMLRRTIARKIPELKPALITLGQRKQLKT